MIQYKVSLLSHRYYQPILNAYYLYWDLMCKLISRSISWVIMCDFDDNPPEKAS